MKTTKKLFAAAVLSTSVLATAAVAAPYQSSTAMTPTGTTITFSDRIAEFTPLTNQYGGVTFEGLYQQIAYGGLFPGIAGGSAGNYQDGVSQFQSGAINFDAAVSDATFNFVSNPGSTVISSFLNGSLVETTSFATSYDGLFTGFRNSRFDRITINAAATENGVFTFDNLSFTAAASAVPEPATWGMMILGFAVIGGILRRRIRASEVTFTQRVRAIAAS